MTLSIINVGTTANDGTGDTIRAAFTKANANFAALAPVVNTITGATGAQSLAFTGLQETYYDITMTAASSVTLGAGLPGQSMIVVFHGAYTWTGPTGVFYANGSAPVPQCSATLIDVVQYTVLPNGSILGTPIVLGASAPSIAVSAFSGTTYAAASMTVSGTYTGAAPTNVDYSIDGAAFTTLTAGTATITNGTFSFPLTAPAAGSHIIQVRETGSTIVSPSISFTVAAATVPAAPTIALIAGNTQNTLSWTDGSTNGSAITSHKLYRGTAAGAEVLIGTISTGSPYADTGLTNGTVYYYKLSAVNGVGEGAQSTEASATPVASASFAVPAHYLNGTSTLNAVTSSATTGLQAVTDGYIDIAVWVAPTSYTATGWLVSKWTPNTVYGFYIDSSGNLNFPAFSPSNTFVGLKSSVTLPSAITPSSTNGIWLRVQANLGSAAVTAAAGSAVSSIPAGSVVFSYANPTSTSADSNTWTQLGTTQTGAGTTGFATASETTSFGTMSSGSSNSLTGKFYKALVRNSSGTVMMNPDFSTLATGATTLTDTAATPVTYTISAGAEA